MERIKLFKVHQPPHNKFLDETMMSGMYAEGPKVAEFEDKLKNVTGNEFTLTVSSGTSALFLAYYLSGLEKGKAIITTPITSPATNISIPRLGGQILWADVDKSTGNISPESVGRLLDKYQDKVAAVVGVNWAGMPCDWDKMKDVVNGRAVIIEDAAHALGALYKGKLVGADVDFSCYSFQAIKHITTGDGGMLTCSNKHVYGRAKRLRWFGIDRGKVGRAFDDDVFEAGFKFHMNDIAASIGLAQLEDLPEILKRRREIANYYEKELDGVVDYQKTDYDASSSYWLFTTRVKNRKSVISRMDDLGVDVSPVHCRNDNYSCFKDFTLGKDNLVNTNIYDNEMLCIPVGDWLNDGQIEHVVKSLKKSIS